MSCHPLSFPTYLKVLHVEQEVAGDDQSVLDCVLQADVERTVLLEEEKMLKGERTGRGTDGRMRRHMGTWNGMSHVTLQREYA